MQDLIICSVGCHAMEMAEIGERINRVLGTIDDLQKHPGVALAVGNEFKDPFPIERAATIIDPTAFASRSAKIGKACVIYPGCFIGWNAVLGDRVFSLSGSVINHDNVLEDGVCLCSNVTLAGGVHVEAGAYLGQACAVRQYLRLGKNSFIGMGAVVVRDVPPNAVMAGNPARKLKDRFTS